MKRADLVRTVSHFQSSHVRKDRALPPHTCRHVGCGRLQVLRLFSVDQALQRHLHRTSEPREVMRAFREAKVPKAVSCAEIRRKESVGLTN